MHPALHGHQHCTVLGLDAQRYHVTDGELEELFVRLRSVSVRWVFWWVRMQSGPLRPVVARALAEAVRFELTDPCGSAVFKTAGLNHSPKPPGPAIRIVAQGVRAARRFGNAAPRPSWEGPGADKQLTQTVMLRLAEAFETAKVPLVPLVPQIQLSGGEGGNAFGTLQALMRSIKAQALAKPASVVR
jgi:hypothetical protein